MPLADLDPIRSQGLITGAGVRKTALTSVGVIPTIDLIATTVAITAPRFVAAVASIPTVRICFVALR